MNKLEKSYLMVGGTFLPAIIMIVGVGAITKSNLKLNSASILAGIVGLIVGGGFTANVLKKLE